MRFPTLSALTLSILLPACSSLTTVSGFGPEEVLRLEVAPRRVACVGEMRDQCLQVRAPGEETWSKFYDAIEGFDYQEGFLYTLEVGRRERLPPPADASAYAYRLIRVVDKVQTTG